MYVVKRAMTLGLPIGKPFKRNLVETLHLRGDCYHIYISWTYLVSIIQFLCTNLFNHLVLLGDKDVVLSFL